MDVPERSWAPMLVGHLMADQQLAAQSTAPCSERFSIELVDVKSLSLSSWLTFNLPFQRGFGTSRLQKMPFVEVDGLRQS